MVLNMAHFTASTYILNEGRIRINTNKGYNFLDVENNILSSQWFTYATEFCNGFARVQREDYMWNFIDRNGNILSKDMWFIYCDRFHGGLAKIQREDGLFNIIF